MEKEIKGLRSVVKSGGKDFPSSTKVEGFYFGNEFAYNRLTLFEDEIMWWEQRQITEEEESKRSEKRKQ